MGFWGVTMPNENSAQYENVESIQFAPQAANFVMQLPCYGYLCIPAGQADPMTVLDVLNCIYTNAQIHDAFIYGIQGVDWEPNADDSYTRMLDAQFNNTSDLPLFEHGTYARIRGGNRTPKPYPLAAAETMIEFPAVQFTETRYDTERSDLLESPAYNMLWTYLKEGKSVLLVDSVIDNLTQAGLMNLVELYQEQYSQFLVE